MQMQTLTGERRTVTLIKMHNFALLASAVLCCICIKCGSEPLTTSLPNRRAIYLPSTLHLDRCLRTGFYFGGACFLLFITLSGAHRHRQRHRPKMLRVRWLRSAFISRMSDLPPRGGVPAPSPTSAIFTIKKLNTEFTLSLDGLVGKTPFHGRAAETDIIIAAVAAAILRRRVASDVAGGGCVRRSGSRSPFRQEFALLR